MTKILRYESPLEAPQIWVAHWGPQGINEPGAWHQVWIGPFDDVYWTWNANGAANFYAPEDQQYSFAQTLCRLPELVSRVCYGCWYAEGPWAYNGPRVLQWGAKFGADKPRIPAIWWPHVWEWDNNPPGFYYPWQTPLP